MSLLIATVADHPQINLAIIDSKVIDGVLMNRQNYIDTFNKWIASLANNPIVKDYIKDKCNIELKSFKNYAKYLKFNEDDYSCRIDIYGEMNLSIRFVIYNLVE